MGGGLFGVFFFLSGVMVFIGATIDAAIALYFGAMAGFWIAVGAGVLVQIGVNFVGATGPNFSVGSGRSITTTY